jgi:hypothetical protein
VFDQLRVFSLQGFENAVLYTYLGLLIARCTAATCTLDLNFRFLDARRDMFHFVTLFGSMNMNINSGLHVH